MTKKRITTDRLGEDSLCDNPFGALNLGDLPSAPSQPSDIQGQALDDSQLKTKRGRVDIIREKSGRGGKVVTVVKGLDHIKASERERFLKQLKNICATGGALKGGTLEIQGDQRERVASFFEKEGFRPVFAGG